MESIRMERNVAGIADTPLKVVSSPRPRNNTMQNSPLQASHRSTRAHIEPEVCSKGSPTHSVSRDASVVERVQRVPASRSAVVEDQEVYDNLKKMLLRLLPAVVTPEVLAQLAAEYARDKLPVVWQRYHDVLYPNWHDLTGFLMGGLTTGHSLHTARKHLTSPTLVDKLVVGGAVSGLLLARDAGLHFEEGPFMESKDSDFFWVYAGLASSLLKGRGLSNAETEIILDFQAINYTRQELVPLLNDEDTLVGDALYRVTLPRLGVEERYRAWAAGALLEYTPAELKMLLHDEPNLMAMLEEGLEDRKDQLAMVPQPAPTTPTPCTSPQPQADGAWTRLGAAWRKFVVAVNGLAAEVDNCCCGGAAAALASCKGAASAVCTYVSSVFRSIF